MKARERYKYLFVKYWEYYSYGWWNFTRYLNRLSILNRKFKKYLICITVLLLLGGSVYARGIDTIIIHHTGEHNIDVSAEQIDKYHKERGWKGIGYHYIIRRNGDIEKGRADYEIGAHAKNRNENSIGIVLSGRDMTLEQKMTLSVMLKKMVVRYNIKSIERHHEECPGESVAVEKLNAHFCE